MKDRQNTIGADPKDSRTVKPKIFAVVGSERDPAGAYDLYASKRPDDLKPVDSLFYYPTSLCRVQITLKTSTNITRYLYSRGPVRQVFSQRASNEFDSSYGKKFCLSIGISFLRFFLTEILK